MRLSYGLKGPKTRYCQLKNRRRTTLSVLRLKITTINSLEKFDVF